MFNTIFNPLKMRWNLTLADIKQNKKYKISKISTSNNILLERFMNLGMYKGAITSLLEKSIDKNTIAVIANNTRIALRITEAKEIIVKEI